MQSSDVNVSDFHPVGTVLPLPMSRDLYFTKQFDQASIAELSKSIIEINKNDVYLNKLYPIYGLQYEARPIKIYIDSYGGSVYQCYGLLAIMDDSKTPVHTYVTGTAMSCGFMMAIHGHKRYAYKHATLMYHQISSSANGKVQDIIEDVEESKRLQNMLADMVVKKTKISGALITKNQEIKKDWFMNADEALKNGVIDFIIS